MKSLAIIPARGGSKRLPRKNLKLLGGKPLVAHTLAAAQDSGCFEQVLLSSDDEEILGIAANYPVVEPWVRPEQLSGDRVTALELVCDITSDPAIQEAYDVVALLLPTCPFRTAAHIREGFELLTPDVDGVVSLTTYEFPPQLSVTLEQGLITPVFEPCPLITGNTRSQDQKVIYRPNGGFYIQWMKSFRENRNFWKGKVRGYEMDRLDSADIDTELDLQYAQFVLENRE
jgi:CMP-N-acetylneuraminic acid synthetase